MKKIISLALSAALVLAMGVSAFAATSIVGGSIGNVGAADVAAAGLTGAPASIQAVTDMAPNVYAQINSDAELAAINSVFAGKSITLLGQYDITGTGGWFIVHPTYSANIVVLHQVNGVWERLQTANLGGQTAAFASSFSPVAVFSVTAASTTTTTTTTTTATSPKTGEVNTVAIALSGMAVASVVAYGVSRKKEEN